MIFVSNILNNQFYLFKNKTFKIDENVFKKFLLSNKQEYLFLSKKNKKDEYSCLINDHILIFKDNSFFINANEKVFFTFKIINRIKKKIVNVKFNKKKRYRKMKNKVIFYLFIKVVSCKIS
jgi:hypothetical protein